MQNCGMAPHFVTWAESLSKEQEHRWLRTRTCKEHRWLKLINRLKFLVLNFRIVYPDI